MRPNLFEIKYFETYYFANIINNVLRDPFPYLRSLNDFFGDHNYKNFLQPFPKISRLHEFIMFIVNSIHFEDINEKEVEAYISRKNRLWVEIAFEHYDYTYEKFDDWLLDQNKSRNETNEDDIIAYLNELQFCGPYQELLERMSEEIFFILFLNRQCLQQFNTMISNQIEDKELDELDEEDLIYFKKNGILKRINIPVWVQRAVLYRDRGMCASCNKDISGQISIGAIENFDHIIPLKLGGINDVTNIQLLCEACNKSKQAKSVSTSLKYERWY